MFNEVGQACQLQAEPAFEGDPALQLHRHAPRDARTLTFLDGRHLVPFDARIAAVEGTALLLGR